MPSESRDAAASCDSSHTVEYSSIALYDVIQAMLLDAVTDPIADPPDGQVGAPYSPMATEGHGRVLVGPTCNGQPPACFAPLQQASQLESRETFDTLWRRLERVIINAQVDFTTISDGDSCIFSIPRGAMVRLSGQRKGKITEKKVLVYFTHPDVENHLRLRQIRLWSVRGVVRSRTDVMTEIRRLIKGFITNTTIIPENNKATYDLYFDYIEFVRKGTIMVQLSRRPTHVYL